MKTCHLVFQTHWDREWYLPFETYRYRLVHVIKRVLFALDHGEIDRFVLDGQTLPLTDFLEVCEQEDKDKILSFIKSNQIIIGPWFIAMDEFLVQGESIIRNLEIGQRTSNQYGKNQRLGYLPDTFGHIGQMPQILKQFDIEDAMMWRGINLDHTEFIWEGKDGSQLFTIFLSEGYYQDGFNALNYQEIIGKYVEKVQPKATTSHMLYTAGGDHLMPSDASILTKVQALNKQDDQIKFVVSDYETYIDSVKKEVNVKELQILKGELRDNTNSYILPNVLSTRSYLKVLNQKLEDLMLHSIEPLMVLGFLKHKAPNQYVDKIWKTILENQPHDSICGCSVDEVHQENEMRAKKAFQMIEALKTDIQSKLGLKPLTFYHQQDNQILDDEMYLSIYSPYAHRYHGTMDFDIYLHDAHAEHDGIEFQSMDGKIYKAEILSIKKDRLFESPLDYPPAFRQGRRYKGVVHIEDLAPMAITSFKIITKKSIIHKDETEYSISNSFVNVLLEQNGSLTVTDKINHKTYEKWNQFYSSLDQGDSYNYSKPLFDKITFGNLFEKPKVIKTDLFEQMTYKIKLELPEALHVTRNHPSDKFVETIIHVSLTLYHDKSQVFTHVSIDQNARDQRLRVDFNLGKVINESYSDQPFEIVKRDANREEVFETTRLKEVDVVVDPSISMVVLKTDSRGIEFFHRGLSEYQTYKTEDHTQLAITLIRSVSHLSRDDFRSRGGAAGPNLETKEAQMLGTYEFDYVFGPSTKDKKIEQSYHDAQMFRRKPVWFTGKIKDKSISLLNYDHPAIDHTSIRMIDENTYEIRYFNLTGETQILSFSTDLPYQYAYEVQLNKKVIKKLEELVCTFKPYEIKTIHLKR